MSTTELPDPVDLTAGAKAFTTQDPLDPVGFCTELEDPVDSAVDAGSQSFWHFWHGTTTQDLLDPGAMCAELDNSVAYSWRWIPRLLARVHHSVDPRTLLVLQASTKVPLHRVH